MWRLLIGLVVLAGCGRFGFEEFEGSDGSVGPDSAAARDAAATVDVVRPDATAFGLAGADGAVVIDAPGSVMEGALEADGIASVFLERGPHKLTDPVVVNLRGAGMYSAFAVDDDNPIDAGTRVMSYFVHADKVGSDTADMAYDVTLWFHAPVVGLITSNELHTATDGEFAAADTVYPATGRALDDADDAIEISQDETMIRLTLQVNTALDHVRVLVAVP